MSDLPPILPHLRIPTQQIADSGLPLDAALEDQDNFVRNLGTVLLVSASGGAIAGYSSPPVAPSSSAGSRAPILSLPEIKLHCRIELDQMEEDSLLLGLEMAARLHTENYLRYLLDPTDLGENIKQALLMLVAHWYRNRETLMDGKWVEAPLAYCALLSPERDYPTYT